MSISIEGEIHVHCPNCSNKRLFDCGQSAEGIIKIKCPCCRSMSVFNLKHVTAQKRKRRIAAYEKAAKRLHIETEPRISIEI